MNKDCILAVYKYIANEIKSPREIYQLGIDSIRFVNPRKLMYFLTILFYILVYLTEQNGGSIIGLEWRNDISKFA